VVLGWETGCLLLIEGPDGGAEDPLPVQLLGNNEMLGVKLPPLLRHGFQCQWLTEQSRQDLRSVGLTSHDPRITQLGPQVGAEQTLPQVIQSLAEFLSPHF
jgi:hypothetical protein